MWIAIATLPILAVVLLERLALLQQKDYLRARVYAERRNYVPLPRELTAIFCAFIIASGWNSLSYAVLFLVVIEAALAVLSLAIRRVRRPRFTARAVLIAVVAMLLAVGQVVLLWWLGGITPWSLAAGVLSTAFSLLWLLLAANSLTRWFVFRGHRREMARAAVALQSLVDSQGLKVIGITGSYGKSATKAFLNTLLQSKYSILTTTGSINTDIGLARSFNTQLAKLTPPQRQALRFAVLEMDTYLKGTLERVTRYFPLDWGLITNINEQHLETFDGEIANTVAGNYEMFQGLARNRERVGVFNLDNEHTNAMRERFLQESGDGEVYSYGVLDGSPYSASTPDLGFTDVSEIHAPGRVGLRFTLKASARLGGGQVTVELPVLGAFNASNFAGAALLALLAGMSLAEIAAAAKDVELKEKTLAVRLLAGGELEVIDDSFSANPASAAADIALLRARQAATPRQNLVLFTGLVDLHDQSARIHAELGEALSQLSETTIWVSNSVYAQELRTGADNADATTKILSEDNAVILLQTVAAFVAQPGAKRIMIIGRIPAVVSKYISSLPL